MTPIKRVCFLLIIALGTVAVALALAETLLRVSGLGAPLHLMVYNDTLVKGRPFGRFTLNREGVHHVQYNSWGFNDREHEMSNDNYRLLFLGDSMVEGLEVPQGASFMGLLDERFRTQRSRVEVINAGFGGSGTAYEYMLWEQFFRRKIRIDHIILCVFLGNDLEDNSLLLVSPKPPYMPYVDSSGSVQVVRKQALGSRLSRNIRGRSALVNVIMERTRTVRGIDHWETRAAEATTAGANLDSEGNEAVTGTMRLIERWAQELNGDRVGLSILILNPGDFYASGRYRGDYYLALKSRLTSLRFQKGLDVIELDLSDYDPFKIYWHDGQTIGHFNELGHRVASDRIWTWLSHSLDAAAAGR